MYVLDVSPVSNTILILFFLEWDFISRDTVMKTNIFLLSLLTPSVLRV